MKAFEKNKVNKKELVITEYHKIEMYGISKRKTFVFSVEKAHAGETSVMLNICSGTDENEDSSTVSSTEPGESAMIWFIHLPKLSWLCNPSLTRISKESLVPMVIESLLGMFVFT